MSDSERRRATRYTTSQPVLIALGEVVASETRYLNNISEGGLAFDSLMPLELGTILRISLPVVRPLFTVQGRVVWCRAAGVKYEIGLEFLESDAEKRNRIVALVRYVDAYRKRAAAGGRNLSVQEATLEWLDRFGAVLFRDKRAAPG